jgi:hypothetical protein
MVQPRFDEVGAIMLKMFSKPKAPSGPQPRAARDAIACSATVRAGNAFHRGQLQDVSQSGCKLALSHRLEPGEHVQVALQAYHSLGGTIRWCRNGMVGIQFARPLSDAALATWKDALSKSNADVVGGEGWRRNFLGEYVREIPGRS